MNATLEKPAILELTPENFAKEVLQSDKLMLVDFWGENCSFCRPMAVLIEDLAAEFSGRVRFGKFKVGEHNQFVSQYPIMALPTVLYFKNGEVVDQVVGLAPKKKLVAKITEHLPGGV